MSSLHSPLQDDTEYDLERHRALFSAPDQFIYFLPLGHEGMRYLGHVQEVTGYSSSELDGVDDGWESIIHPDDIAAFRNMASDAEGSDGERVRAFRIVRKNGDVAHCEDRRRVMLNGECHIMVGQVTDWTRRHDAEQLVIAQARELDALYRIAPIGLALLDTDLRFTRINQELADINGHSPEDHIGRTAWDIVPALRSAAEPLLQRVLQTGQAIGGIEIAGETQKLPGVARHWVEQFYPVHDEANAVVGIGLIVQEVTEKKQAERARDILTRELHHRLKNIYAVISGLVSATARNSASTAEMAEKLRGRIFALSRAQDASDVDEARDDGKEGPVTMERLLRRIVEPLHSSSHGRISVSGPAVSIPPSMASAFALCLHELATNSMKHGALGEPEGLINIDWSSSDGAIKLNWNETGPFSLEPPDRTGFGIQIMRQSVVQQLGGTIDFVWNARGVDVRIVAMIPVVRE